MEHLPILKRLPLMALLLLSSSLYAAINPQYGFESGVPQFVKVAGRGQVSPSTEKFKDGKQSLKFSWLGQSEMVFSNYADIEASMKVQGAGIIVWIYNTSAMNAPLRFTFKDWNNQEICHFDFNMDFTGWRTAWIKYADMPSPDGHYGDKKLAERNTNVAKMTVTAPRTVPSGTIYMDRLTFSKTKLHDQITPDQQIPQNNCNLTRSLWHWCRLWDWENYPELQAVELTDNVRGELKRVEERLDKWAASNNPSSNYVESTLLKRADEAYTKYGIRRLEDGSVTGAPLLSDDEFNNSLGEMRIRFVQEIIYWYALDYLYNGNKSNLDRIFNTFDHAIDQGWAYGSGMGTNHHYGYQIRDLYKAMWILRDEIAKRGKTELYVKTLSYWSGIAEVRKPYQVGRDGILDAWHTLGNARVISAMMQPDEGFRAAYIKALSEWISSSLNYSPGTMGGLKPDGTTFHHGGHYPAYSVGAFAALGDFCGFVQGTSLNLTKEARTNFKYALLTLDNYTNLRDWGLGVCGRHPFNGNIPYADVNAFGRLALCGDLTGDGESGVDPQLGGAYLALGGKEKEITAAIKKAGVQPWSPAEGFSVYNYGAFGIHRRGDWMLTLKGYNSDVWASEIYAADNRYGRYLSYGSVQLIGPEKPLSAKSSGYSQEGWDWNHIPGTTTIHLPYDLLDSPLKGTLMEKNSSRFPGVSSLEGQNGCLAFTYTEKDRERFCAGATATKSVFCFDNRIIFIGTGITNNSAYPTHTTLYQLRLDQTNEEIDIDDDFTSAFPFSYRQNKSKSAVISDTHHNFYFIKDARNLVITKEKQTSPMDTKKWEQAKINGMKEGNFATAYLDHGVSPRECGYEYMMLIAPSSKEVSKFKKKLPYTVLRADNGAHIVRDGITGITAYILYKEYSGNDALLAYADKETIVMEKTDEKGLTVMSVCTPDLGLTEKKYTTDECVKPLQRKVVLSGEFRLDGDYDNVRACVENGRTVLEVSCLGGQPVEFKLKKQ